MALELIVVLLAIYSLGFLLGWLAWGRNPTPSTDTMEGDSE